MQIVRLTLLALGFCVLGSCHANQRREQPAGRPNSFRAAKVAAANIYASRRVTFYCGCSFTNNHRILPETCGYEPRKGSKRSQRVEWEHVVPAAAFGQHRACWVQTLCEDRKRRKFKGRKCCSLIDAQFRMMEADLHNLVPAIGELNGDRSNFAFGDIPGEPRLYGACDFEVDWSRRIAEVADHLQGDVARIYLYMYQTYGSTALPLRDEDIRRFKRLDVADPPDDWEQERSRRIERIQGAAIR